MQLVDIDCNEPTEKETLEMNGILDWDDDEDNDEEE
jgi:hypothetical protein